jgi:hypothetical protein
MEFCTTAMRLLTAGVLAAFTGSAATLVSIEFP